MPAKTLKTPSLNVAHTDPTAILMARKYVWWEPPETALGNLRLLFTQMMTLGTMEDLRWLLSVTTTDDLKLVLENPVIGFFTPKAWHFWHNWLGVSPIPELPQRVIPDDA